MIVWDKTLYCDITSKNDIHCHSNDFFHIHKASTRVDEEADGYAVHYVGLHVLECMRFKILFDQGRQYFVSWEDFEDDL